MLFGAQLLCNWDTRCIIYKLLHLYKSKYISIYLFLDVTMLILFKFWYTFIIIFTSISNNQKLLLTVNTVNCFHFFVFKITKYMKYYRISVYQIWIHKIWRQNDDRHPSTYNRIIVWMMTCCFQSMKWIHLKGIKFLITCLKMHFLVNVLTHQLSDRKTLSTNFVSTF